MKWKISLLPLFAALLSGALLESLYRYPKNFWFLISAALVLVFFALWKINTLPFFLKFAGKRFWYMALPLLMFVAGIIVFSVFLENSKYVHVCALIVTLLVYVYLSYIMVYFRQPLFYEDATLQNLILLLNTANFFLLTTDFLAAHLLLQIPFFSLFFLYIGVVYLLISPVFWIMRFDQVKSFVYSLVILMCFAQLFWAMRFLPLNYTIASFCITVLFHLALNLSIFWIRDEWEFKVVRKYIIIGMVLFVSVFGTAQWR